MQLWNRFYKKFSFNSFAKNLKNPKRNRSKITLQIGVYVILGLILIFAVSFAWFAKDLPTPSKIAARKATESTKIYDRTGQILLYETGEQKRTLVGSDQISNYLKSGTVATEDANFYRHHGFSTGAILSAVYDRLTGKTSRTRGGSTITQQYVKNSFLTSDRSLARKFKELILSIELEFMYSKDQILTMYLNEIPYGNGTAGVEAASSMYFGKHANELDLAQAATLIAIPQSPTYYSPYGTHAQALVNRRNYILDRMAQTGQITKDEAEKAKAEDTTTLGTALKPRKDSFQAPHFSMYVIDQLVDQYGDDKVQKEGLKVISTLDYPKQQQAEQAIADGSKKIGQYGASNAAMVAEDPKTGEILAMVGSKDYFDTSIDGNVNVTDSLRQPGSSFKPIAYATAFKQPEYSPSKIIFDVETNFGGNPPYIPHNYNMHNYGPITMRQALSNSLNVPAVKIMSLAGIDNVLRTAQDLGITTLTHRDQYGLSLVLGAGEVKPVQMANAFSTFANNGIRHDVQCILKVTDSKGNILKEYKPEEDAGHAALDPQVAYEMSDILKDNNARSLVFGTRSSLYFPNRIVALKTGTTSDFKDAWTVGFTPSIAVAVWVGNNNSTAMKSGADGSVIAAPIFHNFIDKALADKPNEDFIKPEGIQQLAVEKYSNKLPNANSKETTTDIFASWQIPTDQDNIHQTIKVCKNDPSRLAPKDLPENLSLDKIFTIIHSERPDSPAWEGPVIAWAQQNGMADVPPADYCDANSLRPSVSITSPQEGSTLSGEHEISVISTGATTIKSVEFFVDGISVGSSSAQPFVQSYNFNNLANGKHKLFITATDENGTNVSTEININTVQNSNGATISNIQLEYQNVSAGSRLVQISWRTDVPATGQISAKSIDGLLTKESELYATKNTTHSIILSLPIGQKYNLTITSQDDSGHTTSALKQTDLI